MYLVLVPPSMRGFIIPKELIFINYIIVATHNPQDFFEGIEPKGLAYRLRVSENELKEKIKEYTNGGYTVIVFPCN